jgi:hypothetical protein
MITLWTFVTFHTTILYFWWLKWYLTLKIIHPVIPRPYHDERGDTMKTHKKGILGKDARELEAKFWMMMRSAGPGKKCLS